MKKTLLSLCFCLFSYSCLAQDTLVLKTRARMLTHFEELSCSYFVGLIDKNHHFDLNKCLDPKIEVSFLSSTGFNSHRRGYFSGSTIKFIAVDDRNFLEGNDSSDVACSGYYIMAVVDITGNSNSVMNNFYRLKGFAQNDFSSFLMFLKKEGYKKLGNPKKMAKNFSVENLDLECLYKAYLDEKRANSWITKGKYSCLNHCCQSAFTNF